MGLLQLGGDVAQLLAGAFVGIPVVLRTVQRAPLGLVAGQGTHGHRKTQLRPVAVKWTAELVAFGEGLDDGGSGGGEGLRHGHAPGLCGALAWRRPSRHLRLQCWQSAFSTAAAALHASQGDAGRIVAMTQVVLFVEALLQLTKREALQQGVGHHETGPAGLVGAPLPIPEPTGFPVGTARLDHAAAFTTAMVLPCAACDLLEHVGGLEGAAVTHRLAPGGVCSADAAHARRARSHPAGGWAWAEADPGQHRKACSGSVAAGGQRR